MKCKAVIVAVALLVLGLPAAMAQVEGELIFNPGELKPVDSELAVHAGDVAPDFRLESILGETVSLSDYRGEKNVVLSFVPAAWTPVCSGQWPGYNILQEEFEALDAVLIGISVDNVPTLYAWTREMGGLWFPVLSDFWPHGQTAMRYGILRTDGTSERALFVIDKQGIVRWAHVGDINVRPELGMLMRELEKAAGR